jgi:hypothetical protein
MELMALKSSVLFDLSIQHVSTQKYRRPSFLACSPQNLASLALAGTIYYISKGDLLSVRPPSV